VFAMLLDGVINKGYTKLEEEKWNINVWQYFEYVLTYWRCVSIWSYNRTKKVQKSIIYFTLMASLSAVLKII
jgi:hypothetical protein